MKDDAKRLLAEISAEIARAHVEEAAARGAARRVAERHEEAASAAAGGIRAPRGSALEDEYLSHVLERGTARAVEATE
ncbi:hypothetical protein [Oceanithermus sp.]|uniref:hypothetical protein n=1 Tax=Oceanithermus sp. TaxID=2268145 RepID=UPI002579934C|nr:hypothetical protein [Oceanithermus sp.]